MEDHNIQEETSYAKKQYHMSQITAVCSVVVMCTVLYTASFLIPKINVTYENMQLVMEDLQVVTSELAEADLTQMIQNMDHLVVTSEKNIQTAMEKVKAIDIDELNRAIKNLSDAVEPFADFFNKFKS